MWKTYVRRKLGEQLSPKCLKAGVQFGAGSVMVCGMISGNGVGPLARLHGKVNVGVYKQRSCLACAEKFNEATFHIHAGQCPMSQD